MAALNFPGNPSDTTEVTTGDITWKWNGKSWYATTEGGSSGGGASVSVGYIPPSPAQSGDLWWNSHIDNGRLYVYYDDVDSAQWVEASPIGGGSEVYLSKTEDDTAAGAITFEGTTTHEAGVKLSGTSTSPSIGNGLFNAGGNNVMLATAGSTSTFYEDGKELALVKRPMSVYPLLAIQ